VVVAKRNAASFGTCRAWTRTAAASLLLEVRMTAFDSMAARIFWVAGEVVAAAVVEELASARQ